MTVAAVSGDQHSQPKFKHGERLAHRPWIDLSGDRQFHGSRKIGSSQRSALQRLGIWSNGTVFSKPDRESYPINIFQIRTAGLRNLRSSL